MRNILKIIALAMVIGASTAAYAQQKSITIAGIPNDYRGKIAMLALAPSPGSQSYTAYSLGTISGASVTFPLSDWKTDGPWSGSGNFAFIILIGETAQAIAGKQYLYTGQTAATSSVNSAATTVQWSQFVSATQSVAPQQPAAPSGNTYIITGGGTSFSASRGGTAVGTGPITNVIAAIKTNANGANITVQFGDGTNTLDLGKGNATTGNAGAIFSGAGWGTVTVTGKVTADRSGYTANELVGYTVGFIGVNAVINADITNSNSNYHALGVRTTSAVKNTLTVIGGTITGGDNGIGAMDDSVVIVNGGSIRGKTGIDLGNNAKLTVNGGTITGTNIAGVYLNNNSNSLTVTGGTITGTGNSVAINCLQGGTVTLSGATVISSAVAPGKDNDRATIRLSNGGEKGSSSQRATVTIGAGVTITNTSSDANKMVIFNRPNSVGPATVTDGR